MATREQYKAWERRVIDAFYEPRPRTTALVPGPGEPAVLRKQKYILYVTEGDRASARLVKLWRVQDLPRKQGLVMFHSGSQSLSKVSRGLDGEVFSHPAFDIGGLTNYLQNLGDDAVFVGDAFLVGQTSNIDVCADSLRCQWSKLAQKELPSSLSSDLKACLVSALLAFGGEVALNFVALPEEHRILVCAEDVRDKIGSYFTRCFMGASYAEDTDAAHAQGLFCAVTAKYVTPNINMRNILFEYSTYLTCSSVPSPDIR